MAYIQYIYIKYVYDWADASRQETPPQGTNTGLKGRDGELVPGEPEQEPSVCPRGGRVDPIGRWGDVLPRQLTHHLQQGLVLLLQLLVLVLDVVQVLEKRSQGLALYMHTWTFKNPASALKHRLHLLQPDQLDSSN